MPEQCLWLWRGLDEMSPKLIFFVVRVPPPILFYFLLLLAVTMMVIELDHIVRGGEP